MLHVLFIACVLVAITVTVHAVGLAVLLRLLMNSQAGPPTRFWPITWLLVRIAWCLIFIHLLEIAVWGGFYHWQDCLPDAESAFYFAGVTYTTVGYGDLLLPPPWRMLGPVEGLIGILMCGLSAGLFFAAVSRIYAARFEAAPQIKP
jgi:hypothetical protein